MGAVTCHPLSLRKERFHPHPPPTASATRRWPSAVSTHAVHLSRRKLPGPRSHLLPEQPTSYDRRTWRMSSPASHPDSEHLWRAFPAPRPTAGSAYQCRDDSTCPSAQSCSLPKWSSKDCSLKNALWASQSQSLPSGNSTCDRKVQFKNTLRYNLLSYQIGHKAKCVTPCSVGNMRERSTPTLLVGNLVLSYKITYALTFGPSKSGNLSQRYITLADIWKNTCPKIYWSTTLS